MKHHSPHVAVSIKTIVHHLRAPIGRIRPTAPTRDKIAYAAALEILG